MAVNKNFVVKNGLEVNSNLLIADLDSQTVGIGTTIAPHELHVVGGIGVTNLNVTGVATIANLRVTGPSTFVGVSTFVDGNVFIQKNLFVNGINITGGSGGSIGTDLVIQRHVRAGGIVTFSDSLFVGSGLGQSTGTVGQVFQVAGVSSDAYIGGTLGIGTTNPQDLALHVVGDTRFVGVNTFQGDVVVTGNLDVTGDITYDEITGRNLNISGLATFQSLTAGRVALVGTGDTLTDNAHLLFNSHNRLIIGGGTSIGGATTIVGSLAQSGGLAAFTSNVSANSLKITDLTDNRVVIVGASSEIEDDANFVFDGSQLILGVGATVGGALTVAGATDLNGALDVSGETNFSSGVGIADSIFHIGDDNTQIRFPAADTVTVETGGSEALRVDSSRRLIVGSSQNVGGDQLQVNNAGGSNLGLSRFANNTGGPDLFLTKSRDTTPGDHTTVADGDVIGQIRFRGDDGSNYVEGCRLFAKVNGTVGTNSIPTDLVFGSGTTGAEKVRITSAGDVGIGTITPKGSHAVTALNTAVLAVGVVTAREYYGDGSNLTNLPASTTINNNADNRLITGSGTANTLEGETNLTFDGSQFAVVSGGATVGSALTVAGATDLNGALDVSGEANFSSGVGIADSIFHIGDDNTQIRFPAADTLTVETAGQERLRVVGVGTSVGIGTDAPEHALVVKDTGLARIRIRNDSDAAGSFASYNLKTRNGEWSMYSDGANGNDDYLKFFRAGSGTHLYFYENIDKIGINSAICQVDLNGNTLGDSKFGFLTSTTNSGFHVQTGGTRTLKVNDDGLISSGIVTATGGFALGIHSAGTSVVSGPIKTLNFVGSGNTFSYNAGTDTVDISIAGGGGGGGVTETDTTVSTTNPTGVGSFATASYRSAAVIAQINQLNNDFQVGRYLMIHDGTTVTVVEEAAVSTGSTMLGSFTGVINGSNVELRVTLASAGVSTVTTKIDTVTV